MFTDKDLYEYDPLEEMPCGCAWFCVCDDEDETEDNE